MFAVIEDGNRQHRIQEGDVLSVDYRAGAEVGSSLTFERILIANGGGPSIIGSPMIDGATRTDHCWGEPAGYLISAVSRLNRNSSHPVSERAVAPLPCTAAGRHTRWIPHRHHVHQ